MHVTEHLILRLKADHAMVHFDKDTDIITGLKQKTHYGRPNWDREFEQVRQENPSYVLKLFIMLLLPTYDAHKISQH